MSKVLFGERRQVGEASTFRNPRTAEQSQVGQCEMDSHADTCCLGSNFEPIYFAGKVCNVAPFLSELPNQEGIQICTGSTAFDHPDGGTYILVVNEAPKMRHTMINPNQVRAYGVPLCDDLTVPHCSLGMEIQEVFIPFAMSRTTCNLTTRTPTSWELENCPHLEVTSDAEWDPKEPHFHQDPGDTLEDLLDASVAAYDTRHRRPDIEPRKLAKQWGIGLDTASKTLKATLQAGIHHAVHPLNC